MEDIELPDEVYRKLQELAVPFEDKEPADVIGRLVPLFEKEPTRDVEISPQSTSDLVCKGGTIPHGTRLGRRSYKGCSSEAEVLDGKIRLNGESYPSPSKAANAAARSIGTASLSLNGWEPWEYSDSSTEQWKRLRESEGWHSGIA